MTRLTPGVLVVLFAGSTWLAQGESTTEIAVRILSPAPGEPAIDRVEVVLAVEAPPDTEIEAVELVIDGRLVHRWAEPPYETTHDFGMTGRSHRIVVRTIGPEGVLGQASLETPEVRIDEFVDLELQQLYVTVTDRKGNRVTNLGLESFTVEDGDRRQEIVTFGVGEIPFTATLLIDSSLSMRGRRLEAAIIAARRFVEGMRPLDQAQMRSFSDRLLRATPVAGRSALVEALRDPLEAVGGTAVRDQVYLATRLLERRQGRRAIVLLSDGWDQVSVLSTEDLESAIERSQSVLYWVRLSGDGPTSFHMRTGNTTGVTGFQVIRYNPAPSSWTDERSARQAYRALERLVVGSGGRIVVAENVNEMKAAVADVLDELHEQYAIGYYPDPKAGSGQWRPVSVRLGRRGLEVRTREGYVDR